MSLTHVATAILVTFIWGSAFAIIEIGLQGFPPIFNASLRFLTASIPWIFFIKRPQVSWKFLFLFGLNYVLLFGLMYTGMKLGMPSGLTSLVLQCSALFALILSALILKEHPSKAQICGIIVGLAGISIIATDHTSFSSITAFLLVLGAAFFYGTSSIIIKRAGNIDMLSLLVWGCLIPPIPLLGLSMFFEQGQWQALREINPSGVFSIYYTSLLGTVMAFALWGNLLKLYPASMVVSFNLLIPVFGILTSYLLLDEQITNRAAVGCFVIFLALLLISFHTKLHKINFWRLTPFKSYK